MKSNKIEQFNTEAPHLFKRLCDDLGYVLEEIKISEINEKPWSSTHIYINTSKKLKIEIKQEPYYTDYGFSFFLRNLENNEYNILFNIPHEKQDEEGKFMAVAAECIFSSPEVLDLIQGNIWKELRYIPFQK
jgi:hypothetical protein